jgi:gluconokinase
MTGSTPPPVVVMGVSGSGKTTVGALLAQRLGVPYVEADDLHPRANVAKMAAGIPLTDDDRGPWLDAIAAQIAAVPGVVVSCSALRRRYREVLCRADTRAWFLHLSLDEETATHRVAARTGHFMPPALVASQFQILESLDGEPGLVVDATQRAEQIVATAYNALRTSSAAWPMLRSLA